MCLGKIGQGSILGALIICSCFMNANAQDFGTAFTYQGRLDINQTPASGPFDFNFDLYDAISEGTFIAAATVGNVDVVDGLFTVQLDFGNNAFTGEPRYLEVSFQGSVPPKGTPTTLMPRQELTPSPYAIYAKNSGGGGAGDARTPVNALAGSGTALHVISESGSYYLTENILGESGKRGIEVAQDVTIDLNGFALIGVPGSLDAVWCNGTNISIQNGTIRNWGENGINARGNRAISIERLQVSSNGRHGIIDVGQGSTITNCSCLLNGQSSMMGSGIDADANCVITGCACYNNLEKGIKVGVYCTLTNCTANSNQQNGFEVEGGGTLINCSAGSNEGFGFRVFTGCSVMNCSARSNADSGFRSSDGCSFTNCSSAGNDTKGFETFDSTIRGCAADGNNVTGFDLDGGLVAHSVAGDNGMDIQLDSGALGFDNWVKP